MLAERGKFQLFKRSKDGSRMDAAKRRRPYCLEERRKRRKKKKKERNQKNRKKLFRMQKVAARSGEGFGSLVVPVGDWEGDSRGRVRAEDYGDIPILCIQKILSHKVC